MTRLMLSRLLHEDDRTLGRLIVFCGIDIVGSFTTLELPFRNNQRSSSSIPSAFYWVQPRTSGKFKKHLHVLDVPGRDYILIHAGNWPKDTTGCILIGTGFSDIDNDGKLEVVNSRRALNHLLELVTQRSELIIV